MNFRKSLLGLGVLVSSLVIADEYSQKIEDLIIQMQMRAQTDGIVNTLNVGLEQAIKILNLTEDEFTAAVEIYDQQVCSEIGQSFDNSIRATIGYINQHEGVFNHSDVQSYRNDRSARVDRLGLTIIAARLNSAASSVGDDYFTGYRECLCNEKNDIAICDKIYGAVALIHSKRMTELFGKDVLDIVNKIQ